MSKSKLQEKKQSSERKNLTRIAGEFLVASRFAQHGYSVALQWGSTVDYDLLVFDKKGRTAFIEVKTTRSYPRDWVLQRKYGEPPKDDQRDRFIACVDICKAGDEHMYLFPLAVVVQGLEYRHNNSYPNSSGLDLPLDRRPVGKSKNKSLGRVPKSVEIGVASRHRSRYAA